MRAPTEARDISERTFSAFSEATVSPAILFDLTNIHIAKKAIYSVDVPLIAVNRRGSRDRVKLFSENARKSLRILSTPNSKYVHR